MIESEEKTEENAAEMQQPSVSNKIVPDVNTKSAEDVHSALQMLQCMAEDSIDYFQTQRESLTSEDSECLENAEVKHAPGPLQRTSLTLDEINSRLLSLILQYQTKDDGHSMNCSSFRKQGVVSSEVQKIALVSHSISAYISTLDSSLLHKLAIQIVSDTGLWISRMFRFFDSLVFFHDENRDGLLKLIRMAMHLRYPKFGTDGYEALYTRPPVIYYNDTTRPGLGQHICSQLGLPLSCLSSVPYSTILGSEYKMDISVLEKMILEDINAAKTPLFVVASAGAPMVGHVDSLQRLQELCRTHNIWLHVEGHSLAALCLVSVPNLPSNVGDSMTLPLGTWLGIPSLPCVTLYKSKEASLVHAAGLSQTLHCHLNFLSLWVSIQALGYDNIVQKIQDCFELSDLLLEKLESFEELKIISKGRLKAKGCTYEVGAIGKKSVSTSILFDIVTPVIVFQYVPKATSEEHERSGSTRSPYFDNINSWFGYLLSRQVPSIRIDALHLEQHGVCLRICLLETAHLLNTTVNDIDYFGVCLQDQLIILNATVKQRELFYRNRVNHRKLQVVEISNWVGVGGARYIPEFWADRLNELTDTGKEDINRLNSELVSRLRTSDAAFSVGEGVDGMLCVRFGMADENLDLDELIAIVMSTGQEIEESSKFLETMSEMVKHGIEKANKELIQENQEKILQEGLLRQVPVIGSLVSWWYPSRTETGIKGRSFNLSSGAIESTENIYKYHMQIKASANQTPSSTMKIPSQSSSKAQDYVDQNSEKSVVPSETKQEASKLNSGISLFKEGGDGTEVKD